VGTIGANGNAAQSTGYLRAAVICNGAAPGENPPCNTTAGDQEDGSIELSYTDVRCLQPTAGGCDNTLNGDYAGSLRLVTNVRVTDLNSAGHGGATVQDFTLAVDVPCVQTPKEIGSDCTITTTIDSLLGANAITEVKRAIWELQDVRLYDGGPDGDGSTESGNGVFARAGLFFP
jgi:hypothetical protein